MPEDDEPSAAELARLRACLLEALTLKELARAGWERIAVERPESVAAHSWGVAWLVLALCPAALDRGRALAIAVVHDLAEVRVGDLTPHDAVAPADKRARARDDAAARAAGAAGRPRARAARAVARVRGGELLGGALRQGLRQARYGASGMSIPPGAGGRDRRVHHLRARAPGARAAARARGRAVAGRERGAEPLRCVDDGREAEAARSAT
ncbi:MAG: HD domain-containing protein [Myxococcales bacterium]|nr:HD domain-containing protein [Myxococcales bacterium]